MGSTERLPLLSECFGFDRLELELSGKASDAAERQAMREQLAQIVGAADGSPDIVRQTIAALAERKRQIEQGEVNRAYGLAVQEAVRSCLEAHGIVLDLVDHGFDYEVIDADIEAFGRHGFKVSGLLIEVKATTADEVSLTPLQAKTAGEQEDRFVLCVVPFKRIPELSDDRSPLIAHVREHARIVVGIGAKVKSTTTLIDVAICNEVSLRNEHQLRYTIPRLTWTGGATIAAWVESLRVEPEPSTIAP